MPRSWDKPTTLAKAGEMIEREPDAGRFARIGDIHGISGVYGSDDNTIGDDDTD